MRRIFCQNGIVFSGPKYEAPICAAGSPCYDITEELINLANRYLGPADRQSVFTFAGGLMVTGSALAIAGVAQTFENCQTLSRQKGEIQDQFNHLSEQLAQVAAKLTETESALGRAHDLVAAKQARIDELEREAPKPAMKTTAVQKMVIPPPAFDWTDIDVILKRDWPTDRLFKDIANDVRLATTRDLTDKDIRNRVTRLGLKRLGIPYPAWKPAKAEEPTVIVPVIAPPASPLSPLALRFGDTVMTMTDEGNNPDEIASDLNFGLKRNDHLNAAMVRKIIIEMRAHARLAGAA